MTETAADAAEIPVQKPSTAGMTTKVVKGSLWTLGGSVLPLAVSFISTPFIIRFLGSEAYGVLLLVGLIPTYFSFADFGMGVASTKFAAEAYGQGDEKKEAEVVWTATAISAISALIVAIPVFLFSYQIVRLLNVPEHLLSTASIALKIASCSFFLGILASVLNSPMLARLRMDLNMLTSAIPKILLAAVTPFILYFGGFIVEAVSWAFIVSIAALAVVFYFSGRLLPRLFQPRFNRDLVRPLVKFGGALVVSGLAGVLMGNIEKFVLTKYESVTALAYYSIAFTLANMVTMLSIAITQSLVPAFSQLIIPQNREHFNELFARAVRLNLIWLLPLLMILMVIAKPFLWLWLGSEFSNESSIPFYFLLIGLLFSVISFVPHGALLAAGKTGTLAKLYWTELPFFLAGTVTLVLAFGIKGAAIAWSARAVFDTTALCLISKRVQSVSFRFSSYWLPLVLGFISLLPPVVFVIQVDSNSGWLVPLTLISLAIYGFLAWGKLLSIDERMWAINRFRGLV